MPYLTSTAINHLYHFIVSLSFLSYVFSSRKPASTAGQGLLHHNLRPPQVSTAQHLPYKKGAPQIHLGISVYMTLAKK